MQDTRNLVGKTYCVRTFGCQMNLHDSERVAGILDASGCIPVETPEEADIVCFMTCCVRENADTRLQGQASAMVSAPKPPSGTRIVAIGGCVAQRDGDTIRKNIPNADVVFGTRALSSVPELISQAFERKGKGLIVDVAEHGPNDACDVPIRRAQDFSAWVPIMSGCDNFCTYCIVPYVRGREHSRTMEAILAECAHLKEAGVREVTLLGQNVNSYGRDLFGSPRFAELLREVGKIGIERIRFTSSNPKDLTDEVIRAMAETPHVMPHLHLAVQSGSTRILKKMNRTYTRESYIDLAQRLRHAICGLSLTTDIIVGFPGEEERDFEDTLSLVEEVAFNAAYTFIYSRREGTPAAKMVDDTPHEVIQERFERLADTVARLAYEANQTELGGTVEVLCEGTSKRDPSVMVGHSPKMQTVHFALPEGYAADALVGRMVDVSVEVAKTWYLAGSMCGSPR